MPARQLTLYDFLADYIPGAVAIALLSGILWLTTPSTTESVQSLSTVLVGGAAVAAYPVGRTIHAIAGQDAVKRFRSRTFDRVALRIDDSDDERSDSRIGPFHRDEPTFVGEMELAAPDSEEEQSGSEEKSLDEWIAAKVNERFTGRDLENAGTNEYTTSSEESVFPTDEIKWDQKSLGQLQRFGFSVLFEESTLYQRYNILETFYRNLWLVTAYSAVLASFLLAYRLLLTFVSPPQSPTFWQGVRAGLALGVLCGALVVILAFIVEHFRRSDNTGENTDETRPAFRDDWGYSFLLALSLALVLSVSVVWLAAHSASSASLSILPLLGLSILLLLLALLFDVRRVQFKKRQVRAFINDLYRHDRDRRARTND